jgi:hypothetical protein
MPYQQYCFVDLLLCLCETAFVDSVVDCIIGPLIHGVHCFDHISRVQIKVGVLGKLIELRVHHSNDIRGSVKRE